MTPNDNSRKRPHEHILHQNDRGDQHSHRDESWAGGFAQEGDRSDYRWEGETDLRYTRSHTTRERSSHLHSGKRRPYSHDSYFSSTNHPREEADKSSYYEPRNLPYEDQHSPSRLSPRTQNYADGKSRRANSICDTHENETSVGLLYPFTRSYSEDHSHQHHSESHHQSHHSKRNYCHPEPCLSNSNSGGRRKSYNRERYNQQNNSPRRYDDYRSSSNPEKIREESQDDRYSFMYDLEPAPISSGHYLGHIFETDNRDLQHQTQPWQKHSPTNTPSYYDKDYYKNTPSRSMTAKARSESPDQPTSENISFVTPQRNVFRMNQTNSSSRMAYSHGTDPTTGYEEHNLDQYKPHDFREHLHIKREDSLRIAASTSDGFESSHNDMSEDGSSSRTSSPSKRRHTSNAWNERLKELKQFKEKYGHCMVPQKYPDNVSLGIWVNKQRMEHNLLQDGKKSSMTPDRLKSLENLGFIWAKRKGMTTWNGKYEELLQYKREFGDCLVPTKYSKNPALGRWVSTQREQYRLLQEGKPTKMVDEKIKLLESIGFIWRLQF